MKTVILTTAILSAYLFTHAGITCTDINASANVNTIYKLDADADGVKDFWFYVTAGGNSYYIVGKNGSEIEVDASGGNATNRLEIGHQIGNNFWSDSAILQINGTGNFSSGNIEGYVGLRHYKNGNYYLCYVKVVCDQYGPGIYYMPIDNLGYNDEAGSPLQAGQCPTTAIPEQHHFAANIFQTGNHLLVSLTNETTQGALFQLLNIQGQIIQAERLQAGENRIALNDLAGGIYFVAIQDNDGAVLRKKILLK